MENKKMLENKEWKKRLKDYLFNDLLKRFVSEKQRLELVNDESMKTWEIMFTHSSYDRSFGKNYESSELLGDASLGSNFILYLSKKYGFQLAPNALTEFKRFYMSKMYQGQFAKMLQMDQYVRTGGIDMSIHIAEDVFESFCGGLMRLLDVMKGNGSVYNFIVYLFKDIEIDFSLVKGPPKTQVKEIFDKLHWGVAAENEYNDSNDMKVVVISLSPEAINDLARYDVEITEETKIIGQATSWTKKGAIPSAYLNALKTLDAMGVNDLWISQRQIAEDMSNPLLSALLTKANIKMSNEGYTSIIFDTVQTNREGKIMQLIGITPSGEQNIIAETPQRIQKLIDGKRQLLEIYLQSK
jgi:dsRNA-specific ribonuclease